MTDRRGRFRIAIALWALGLAQLPVPVRADDAIVVKRYGFCITESEGRCVEVALPGAVVNYERLPEDEHGDRYVEFYSLQRVRPGTLVVHLLYGEDQETQVNYVLPDGAAGDTAALRTTLEQVVKRNEGPGAITVAVHLAAPAKSQSDETYVFSRIAVPSPGYFSGRVVGGDGEIVEGTEPVTFSVIRRPAKD
jgi:hypothetical protein